jgi:hypothetical protein
MSDLLIPFTAFDILTYVLFYCFDGWGVKGGGGFNPQLLIKENNSKKIRRKSHMDGF